MGIAFPQINNRVSNAPPILAYSAIPASVSPARISISFPQINNRVTAAPPLASPAIPANASAALLGIPFPQINNRAAYSAMIQTASNATLQIYSTALNAMTTSGCHFGHVIVILPIVHHVPIKEFATIAF
jgi:hypothetical protein